MSEFLTVRLSRQTDAPISWLVWSTSQNDVIASGELGSKAQLEELVPYAEQRTTIVLLDSSDVVLKNIEVPAGASRQLESMLPYLLEEDIAQDVEELHFSILKRISNQAYIAAVDENYLHDCLTSFTDIGIEIKAVIPDVLVLPYLDDGISALQFDDCWLFRKDNFEGIAIEHDAMPLFLTSDWCDKEQHSAFITSYTPIPKEYPEFENKWKAAEPELVMALLTKGAVSSSVNLLSGKFKPQSSILKHLKVWRKVAVAACLFLLLLIGQQALKLNQYEQQVNAYRAESENIFRTIFPNKRKIPTVSYLKGQMNSELNRLSGGSAGESVLDWVAGLPKALANQPSAEIQSVRYDAKRGELRIEASLKDFQTFEVVRTKLAQQFSVVQGPLNKKNNKVSGSFVLRRKQ